MCNIYILHEEQIMFFQHRVDIGYIFHIYNRVKALKDNVLVQYLKLTVSLQRCIPDIITIYDLHHHYIIYYKSSILYIINIYYIIYYKYK